VNVNAFVHSHAEAWPWRGLALAVHVLRMLSALAGMVTLLSIYATARLLWPETPLIALCAAGLAAFLPQFGFLHGVMTNDGFLIAACSLVLYLLTRAALEGFPMRYGIGIGVGVGLAVLAKMTGVALALYTGAWMFGLTWYAAGWRRALRLTMLYGVVVLLLCAWLFWRNQALYGDPTAVSIFVQFGGGERAYSWGLLRAEFGRIWRSAIGVFGWMNVPAPGWVMNVWLAIMAAALLGLLAALARAMRRPQEVILARPRVVLFAALLTWPIVVIGFWLQFLWRTPADQGRLLFPALLPLVLLLAYGLARLGGRATVGAALCMAFFTAVFSAFVQLPRTYSLPEILTPAEIPSAAARLDQALGQGVRILASTIEHPEVHPGETVSIDLYWTIDRQAEQPALVAPEIVGREFRRIASLPPSYHGRGLFPTTLWRPGDVVREKIELPVETGAVTPTEGKVWLRLEGENPLVQIGAVKVTPRTWPSLPDRKIAIFGQGIVLANVTISNSTLTPGDELTVNLLWSASQPVKQELHRFVHIGDPAKAPLAQVDGIPAQGAYPTHWWNKREVIADSVILLLPVDLPPGSYPINVGFYDPQSGVRLAATANGVRATHDAITIGAIVVNR